MCVSATTVQGVPVCILGASLVRLMLTSRVLPIGLTVEAEAGAWKGEGSSGGQREGAGEPAVHRRGKGTNIVPDSRGSTVELPSILIRFSMYEAPV